MTPTFTFFVDPIRSIVRVQMSGFFARPDIERFEQARNEAHRLLRCAVNDHVTLVDIRELQVQSQEAVAAFTTVLHQPAYYARRIAVVVAKTLARSQVHRAAAGREVGYFETIEDAEHWLFQSKARAA